MATILKLTLANEAETRQFAQKLARCCENIKSAIVIYLEGELGAGKTTFARGFIQTFGFGKVKSPTYSLVESYQNKQISIHHFDCYRLSSAEELNYIGIRDYSSEHHIQLIEWATLGRGVIAKADMTLSLQELGEQRLLSISTQSPTGEALLKSAQSFLSLSGAKPSLGGS